MLNFLLSRLRATMGEVSSTDKSRSSGIWLIIEVPVFIHPLSIESEIHQIVIKGNRIYFGLDIHSDSNFFCFDCSNYREVRASKRDISRNYCTRYVVYRDTVFNLIAEAMASCYDNDNRSILSDSEVRNACVRQIAELNSLLYPYKIHTEMTEKSWNFFYNNTPITLEEAIKRLPDEVLSKRVNMPFKAPPEAPTPPQNQPRPVTPSPAQKALTEPPKAPSKPSLSIEKQILNYLKAQPVKWEYPLRSQDTTLNNFCTSLVFSENVTAVANDDTLKSLEMTIQKKRARNPRLADHNAAMEGNILAMLYEYSYLMHIFHAMDAIKFDTTKA